MASDGQPKPNGSYLPGHYDDVNWLVSGDVYARQRET